MTFEEKLGFAVTRELLDLHNEKIQKAKKEFYDVFEKVWDEALAKGIKLFDLSALEDYLNTIKKEYYETGKMIDDIVQSETLKNEIAKATA